MEAIKNARVTYYMGQKELISKDVCDAKDEAEAEAIESRRLDPLHLPNVYICSQRVGFIYKAATR